MIKIEVVLTQSLIKDDLELKDKNVIVIDILRSSTTIAVALSNGAKEIVPTENVSTAAKIARGTGKSLLCGERDGKIVEGFDLGNSPLEYEREVIDDKSLVFSTTNGTSSIVKAKHAKSCAIASFVNLSNITKHIESQKEDLIIICSGKLGNFCLEDAVCAGVIINQVIHSGAKKKKHILGDSEIASIELGRIYALENDKPSSKKIMKMFKKTEHGKYLMSLGLEKDLAVCSEINSYPCLPLYMDGVIKLKDKMEIESIEKSKMKRIDISNKDNQ